VTWKLCTPLTSLLIAGGFKEVDMLSICTGDNNEENKIMDAVVSKEVDVKVGGFMYSYLLSNNQIT